MVAFTLYPAIDVRQGRVVRLAQGDPDRETSYANDPLLVAQRWQQAGATWVHVVNLDGAFGEKGTENIQALKAIVGTGLRVQFGGGLRSMAAIQQALALGAIRVVLGTVAIHNPSLVHQSLTEFGAEHIVLGIDALDGMVRVSGWQETTSVKTLDLALQWAEWGGTDLVFTDISRDGMGGGVNVSATADLATETGLAVIASGGVAALADVQRVMEMGLSGVIIGRALYEGRIDLKQALALIKS